VSIKQIFLTLLTVFLLSLGQILFKTAASKIDLSDRGFIESFLFNPSLILALAIYGFATLSWLLVLKNAPLRLAYPIQAVAFITVPLLSYFLLNEPLKLNTFIGAAIIIFGVFISLL